MKKKWLVALILALVTSFVCLSFSACSYAEEEEESETVDTNVTATDRQLIIYNWGDYIDEDIEEEFEAYYEEKYGKSLNIIYSTFETNEIMLTTVEQGDASIDLVCPSEYAIQKLMERGLVQKLDYSKISTYDNVNKDIYDKVGEVFTGINVPGVGTTEKMTDYFVPYMWGTLGILYDADVVTEEDLATGYGVLWNEAGNPKLDGKILMKDSIRDSYCAAVMYLKQKDRLPEKYKSYSVQELINTVDDELLKAAEEILLEQSDCLKGYEVDFGKGQLTSGRAHVDLAWSGDALWAIEDSNGYNLDYFVPEIGGNIWFDGWCLLSGAKNADVAYEFIDYMCRPDVAIRNSMYIGYTSALDKDVLMNDEDVVAIVEENEYDVEEYFNDELRYPDIASVTNLGVMRDFGDRNAVTIEMWERVKSSKQDSLWMLWAAIGIVGATLVAIGVYYGINHHPKNYRRLIKTAEELEREGAEQ